MSQSADERLVVMLEARVSDFEKRMRNAEGTGTNSYNRLRRGSRGATQQMEADMLRSTTRINQALASTSTKIGSFAKTFALGFAGGAIAAAIAGLTSGLGKAVERVAQLGDEAKRSGLALQTFQEWKFVAEQNRIGIDALVDGFKELNLRADEFIVTGGGSAAEAFARLGYNAADLKKKLKDPSALMLEMIGRMERLDKAAQIRISDELFGGTGGEQFVQLLERGEAGIRKTINTAHEAGVVLDQHMIKKAEELDGKWKALTSSVGGWFDKLAIGWAVIATGAADTIAAVAGMKDAVDDLLSDEARARTVLGNAIYDRIAEGKRLTEEQKGMVEDIARVTEMSLPAVQQMASVFNGIADTMAATNPKLAADLRNIAQNMDALVVQLENGMIEADEFHSKMGDLITRARSATGELQSIDGVGFATVIGGLERLADMLGFVAEKGREARASMPSAVTTGTPLSGPVDGLMPPTFDSYMPASPRPGARPDSWQADMDGDGIPDALQKDTGGGKGKKGGGKSRDEFAQAMEQTREQIAMLEAETLAFLSAADARGDYGGAAEYAKKKAELLMAAQKQGIAITPELTAQIEAQARAYATAGLEAEEAAEKMRQIEEASDRGKDALGDLFGSILDGSKSAKEAVADLLMEIAKAQLFRGIGSLFGSGFTGFLGGMLSYDGGGYTGDAPRSGGLDGKGGFLAMMHPRETVTDHTRGQSAGGGGSSQVDVRVSVDQDGNWRAAVERISTRTASNVVGKAAPAIIGKSVATVAKSSRQSKSVLGMR